MKKVLILTLLALVVVLAGCAARDKRLARKQGITPSASTEVSAPASPTAPLGDTLKVKSMTTIKNYVKSLDWSAKLNKILTARFGVDGYYDVIVMNPDGSGEKCLTCDKTEIPQKHIGGPCWHPSGDYIVMTVEKAEVVGAEMDKYAIPGKGLNNDLYVMNTDGSKFWRIYETEYRLSGNDVEAVIHPQFSHNGKMLLWAERVGSSRPSLGWGEWSLKLADFSVASGAPQLSNIRTLQPGAQVDFYESHAFSPDDTKIMFSGNLEKGQKATGLDIYEYTISNGVLKNLTKTTADDDWDEHAHWTPDGSKVVWMSSTGYDINYPNQQDWSQYLKSDLWVMNADGSNPTQLTFFNVPGHADYKNGARVIVGDSSFSSDGKSLVMAIAYTNPPANELRNWRMIMVEFE